MATDVRGHTVPAAEDPPARADLLRLSSSINDIKVVADATARAQYITDLAAEAVPIVPSSSNPVYVFRSDAAAGAEIEYTTSSTGATWHTVTAGARTPFAMAAGIKSGSMTSDATVTVSETFPVGRFTQAPIVTAMLIGGAGGLSTLRVGVTTTSTTGCTFIVNSVTGASLTVSLLIGWHAVQMTSAAAAG